MKSERYYLPYLCGEEELLNADRPSDEAKRLVQASEWCIRSASAFMQTTMDAVRSTQQLVAESQTMIARSDALLRQIERLRCGRESSEDKRSAIPE